MAAIEQRYAQALADLVRKGAIPAETLRRELGMVAATVHASAPLRRVLASPAVAWEQKLPVLEAIAAKLELSRLTRNFLLVAAQRGRAARIEGMDAAFEQLLLEQEGIVKAEISSARSLSAAERERIEAELSRRLGRKLDPRYTNDPALVGGFLARVGDQIYDGSIRGRLERLRQHLLAGA
ncbi:MAG: ATP synthase F1 subunit delta [Terriglobales bacterium]